MIKKYTLYDFNSLEYVNFLWPHNSQSWECSMCTWTEYVFCCCWVECPTNVNWIQLMILFSIFISFWLIVHVFLSYGKKIHRVSYVYHVFGSSILKIHCENLCLLIGVFRQFKYNSWIFLHLALLWHHVFLFIPPVFSFLPLSCLLLNY